MTFPTYEEWCEKVAEQAIDGYIINGRTIREWIEILSDELTMLDKIRAEILEEKKCAYADFDKYKVDYLGVDSRYVEDELPDDDFRYGMERCIEIIDKYRNEVSE